MSRSIETLDAYAPRTADLEDARRAVRQIERFAMLTLYTAEGAQVERARTLLRLAVGLRRGLDNWKETKS